MFSIRDVVSTVILLTACTPFISGQLVEKREEKRDLVTFQKLLDEAHPPLLHEALHEFAPKKYKHGAFPEDRTAVEVIHKEEPSVATSIVNLARRQNLEVADLNKRQAPDISNGTTTTNAPPPPNPETSTRVTPVPPVSESSTPVEVSTSPAATSAPDTTPAVNTVSTSAPVSTPAESTSIVATTPSTTPSTTPAPSTTIQTTARPSDSLTTGEVITTTNAVGLTIISTVGGGATTISPSKQGITSTNTHLGDAPTSVVVQTSTLPNGSKAVHTAVTVVGAGDSGAGAGDTPQGTAGAAATGTSASPGLQTGEAVMTRGWGREMVAIVGGAVVFAGMM
ncbi:hypothetical protein ACLMJK_006542 [Lecanora helva]